jgi:hypothetical protein
VLGQAGPQAPLGCALAIGLRCWWARKEKGVKGGVERFFIFFKHISNNEFKPEFEFKHNKMMHQHVCNSELLYFII